MHDLIIFEDNELKLEVQLDSNNNTAWLTQKQMAELFDIERSVITKHLKNIVDSGELEADSVCSFFAHTAKDGKKYNVLHYNLDMIISVGYRVNSKKGIIFRKWATNILKDYMLKGYAENEKRLLKLEKTLKLIDIASQIEKDLSSDEAKSIFKVINNYGNALQLLDDYDHKKISKPKGHLEEEIITYEEAKELISEMKKDFDSNLFGLEREGSFISCIATIYQTYDGEDLYSSIEEKAANLLYLIVKNHTFIDGNKRIAAVMFIYYLFKNNLLYKGNEKRISDNALVATTLLIASSNPKEKELIVDLVMNFLI